VNNFVLLAIIVSVIFILLVLRFWLNKLEEKTKLSDELVEWLKSSTTQIDSKLSQSMEMFNTRLDNAARVIAQVQRNIGEFSEIGRSMNELQEFLSSPKLRGNIGEQVLKELLAQHFPKHSFALQYTFKNGEKVDAVIKTTQGMIPIDSKFPMENFRKREMKDFTNDVKKHISDIAKKYILVDEGTCDYALMYIPSESVYYEIINNEELFDYAGQKQVLPVSPMSFYAYMKAILMSFEGQRIQSQAKEILEILKSIKKDYEKSEDALSTLQKHITNAYNQIAVVTKNFLSLGQKLSSTHLLSGKKDEDQLET
jgi:DNA recombination protein RmuC